MALHGIEIFIIAHDQIDFYKLLVIKCSHLIDL
jgi:hypothetical protein